MLYPFLPAGRNHAGTLSGALRQGFGGEPFGSELRAELCSAEPLSAGQLARNIPKIDKNI